MVELGIGRLTVHDVAAVARNSEHVTLSQESRDRVLKSRQIVDQAASLNQVAYGINTGFGALKNKRISTDQIQELQRSFINSHAAGVGPAFPEDVARA